MSQIIEGSSIDRNNSVSRLESTILVGRAVLVDLVNNDAALKGEIEEWV